MLKTEGMQVYHVKPLGELYFQVQREPKVLEALLRAVRVFDVPIYGLQTAGMSEARYRLGVPLLPEIYPDIDYDVQGGLNLIGEYAPVTPDLVNRRIRDFTLRGEVVSSIGSAVSPGFERQSFTICIHSDLPSALGNAAAAREALEQISQAKNGSIEHI
ncbi:hypothetical protein PFICI_06099 [Pestalotiopsis fici W106-1]|uniref:Uncharacterized protein n=1 Tax=Pestalotiopsis fici (strain W106-1 / CGMCC3.15140) TaxID=1229662 RepID=W3X6R6_PESFW|nr:uncharacterized protein PFICI_06099 [Pestalotiopsis fici W106-1]ETS81097.1 hypothetical protein PFICI_06099 [Pestalotiopsis fici W106-1]